jgi:hypothetical protein
MAAPPVCARHFLNLTSFAFATHHCDKSGRFRLPDFCSVVAATLTLNRPGSSLGVNPFAVARTCGGQLEHHLYTFDGQRDARIRAILNLRLRKLQE